MLGELTNPLLPVASLVALASLKGIVVITLVLLCRRLLARWLSAQARHILWLPVIACLLLPRGIDVPYPARIASFLTGQLEQPIADEAAHATTNPRQVLEPWRELPTDASVSDATGDGENRVAVGPASAASAEHSSSGGSTWPSPTYTYIWALIWACVALLLLARTLQNLVRYARIRTAAKDVHPSTNELFLRCKAQLRLNRTVSVLETPLIDSPLVVGCWSPALLLPLGLQDQLGATKLRHVFLHELAHVQRHDVLLNWLSTVAQILHWFNPFVWYGLRALRADMEQACDAKVLDLLSRDERIDYGNTLISLADPHATRMPFTHGLSIVDDHTQLRERITMIAKFSPKKFKYSLVASVAMACLASVALTEPRANPIAQAQPAGISESPGSAPGIEATRSPAPAVTLNRLAATAAPDPSKTAVPAERKAPAGKASAKGIPMEVLIEQVSANIHKKIVVDPRAISSVMLYGQKLDEIDYSDLLTILKVNGFTAYEMNEYINVVPIDDARTLPVPIAAEGQTYPDDQFVSMTVGLKNACAPRLIPILRPLLPKYAPMVAELSSNSLLLTDTFSNLQRIESMVKELDARSRSNGQCEPPQT